MDRIWGLIVVGLVALHVAPVARAGDGEWTYQSGSAGGASLSVLQACDNLYASLSAYAGCQLQGIMTDFKSRNASWPCPISDSKYVVTLGPVEVPPGSGSGLYRVEIQILRDAANVGTDCGDEPTVNLGTFEARIQNVVCELGDFNPVTGECPGACPIAGEVHKVDYSQAAHGTPVNEALCLETRGGLMCNAIFNVDFCAGDNCWGHVQFGETLCEVAEGPVVENELVKPAELNCIVTASTQYCFEQQDANCGTVNGQPVCIEDVPAGNCVFLGQTGGMVCESSAPAPPAPSTTDGSAPAMPDGAFTAPDSEGVVSNYNYYNPTTVNGSGTDTSGSQSDGQADGDGDGDGDGEGFPDGSVSGGANCDVPPACEGNALLCGIITQQWRSTCQDADEAEILAGAGFGPGDDDPFSALPGQTIDVGTDLLATEGWLAPGQCPADLSIDLSNLGLGVILIPLSYLCELAALIGIFVWVGSWLLSLRIVLGAF